MGRVSAAFISLPLRRQEGILPDIPAGPNKVRGTMRSGQVYGE
jgi:hypothetical protein